MVFHSNSSLANYYLCMHSRARIIGLSFLYVDIATLITFHGALFLKAKNSLSSVGQQNHPNVFII